MTEPQIPNNTSQPHTPPPANDDEIDLLALARTLWYHRKTIIRTTVIFAIIGLVVALTSPKEYTATSLMVPQTGSSASKLGGLSGLAAMAGINMNMSNGSEIPPMVYPNIVNSVPFQIELMNSTIWVESVNDSVSLYSYFTKIQKPAVIEAVKKYTIGLPSIIIKSIKGKPREMAMPRYFNGPVILSEDQFEIRKILEEKVSVSVDQKLGNIYLKTTMPEPMAAAMVAQQVQQLLQKYVTSMKIEKAQSTLDFVQKNYDDAKKEYQRAQERLAAFRDRNKNVSLAMARTEEERLTGEFNLSYSVYSELAKQLEQAKISVKEETPVITVIEPVTVPTEKSKPNRPIILIIWTFLGGIAGVGYVFGKEYWGTIKEQWAETKAPSGSPKVNTN